MIAHQQDQSHNDAQRTATAPLIELDGVAKSFGGVQALRGVHFDLRSGEVHALLGQNGAGKSTLIKILAGALSRDQGQIRIEGESVEFRSTAASRTAGVAVVYQELSLVPQMSIADNLYLAREPNRLGLVQRRRMLREARDIISEHGLDLNPATPVRDLPFAYRQLTEIVKALSGNVRILILDEPTSSLSKGEEDILFDAVAQVTRRGVGVIYITHRLREVFRLSDRVTVLRDGQNAGTFVTNDTDMTALVGAIVGTSDAAAIDGASAEAVVDAPEATHFDAIADDAEPLVELCDADNDRLNGVNLSIRAGEIVGLAGLIGSGRTEILETLFGLRRLTAGEMRVDGKPVRLGSSVDAIRHGIGLVPEDRHLQGLVLEHSIERNVVLPWLARLGRWGLFRKAAAMARTEQTMAALSVKAPSGNTRVQNLSGGNQQKIVFGRWHEPGMRLLLLDEPTVGVDVGAREQIYDVVRHVVGVDAAALVVSSDLAELLLLCDRIAIVVDGRIVTEFARNELRNEEHLHQVVQEQQP